MSHVKFVAIHGHFYQPPRESPWLERIEVQDSAAPYHDWNERVAAECYEPNTAARRVDGENRILDVVSNFDALAFDVGPTLLAWLERARPAVYAAILDADRRSRVDRGRGNAIAQAYGHAILPLCSRRDKVTQVRWGLADFRHRFGRWAEGMWLPETAVDRETLEVLAEEGVQFTLLAPSQAAGVRALGGDWQPGARALDPRQAYRCDVGRGRELALFFYDGGISHAIAFGDLLRSGDALATRVLAGLDDAPVRPARPGRHGRGDVRPPPSLRRDGAGGGVRPDPGERRRDPDQSRRVSRGPPAGRRGTGRRGLVVELRARRRALARGLRVPGGAGNRLDPALALAAPGGARLAARRRRPLVRGRGRAPPRRPLGGA